MNKKVIGITGGIASGKSIISEKLIEMNYKVIDADQIAFKVSENENIIELVQLRFGNDYILDGKFNRNKLAELIYNDDEAREKLNSIMHPEIRKSIQAEIDSCSDELIFLDIPLLYEANWQDLCSKVILVYVDENTQITRLMLRDKIDTEYAKKKIKSQMPLKQKVYLADFVIDNNKDISETYYQLYETIKIIKNPNYHPEHNPVMNKVLLMLEDVDLSKIDLDNEEELVEPGMIFVGYQGIGKSTLSKESHLYIDLESSNFFVDGKRDDNWYKVYTNIANNLAQQGYIVFTSSHEVLRNYMREQNIEFVTICPSLELKDAWLNKLETRYEKTKLDKDYRAWQNGLQMYEQNINSLLNEKLCLSINDINYNLEEEISDFMYLKKRGLLK